MAQVFDSIADYNKYLADKEAAEKAAIKPTETVVSKDKGSK